MSAESTDVILTRLLDLVIRNRHAPEHQFVVVSSPPGGGKTMLVELVAATASHLGLRVGIACPRAAQAYDLVRRLLLAYARLRFRLWVGQDRPIPADLRARASGGTRSGYAFGSQHGPPIDVGTVAKFARITPGTLHFDLLIVDEAYQLPLADLEPLLRTDIGFADRFLLVGDPGQLPPLVRIDPEPFATAQFRVHEAAARELLRLRPATPHLRLDLSYRLPPDSIALLQPFYPDLPFRAAASSAERRLSLAQEGQMKDQIDRALDHLASGDSILVLELPANMGRPGQVDREALTLLAAVAERIPARRIGPAGGQPFTAGDIGVVDPHVASGQAARRALRALSLPGGSPMVDTPEVWQGLERPVILAQLAMSMEDAGSAFALDPGRLCVTLTRHQYACVIVARAGLEPALQDYHHDVGARALGAVDRAWQGVQLYSQLWRELRRLGRIIPV